MKKYITTDIDITDDEAKEIAKNVMVLAVEDGYYEWQERYAHANAYYNSSGEPSKNLSSDETKLVDRYARILMKKLQNLVLDIEL